MGKAILPATVHSVSDRSDMRGFTEPHWNYCNTADIHADDINLYFSAYLDMPLEGGGTHRTVVCRLIIPLEVAKRMRERAGQVMNKGGH